MYRTHHAASSKYLSEGGQGAAIHRHRHSAGVSSLNEDMLGGGIVEVHLMGCTVEQVQHHIALVGELCWQHIPSSHLKGGCHLHAHPHLRAAAVLGTHTSTP